MPFQPGQSKPGLSVYEVYSPAGEHSKASLAMTAETYHRVAAVSAGYYREEMGLVWAAHPLVWPAEAAPVPVLCCAKERLEEFEHAVGLQPLLVCFVELLELCTLHVDTSSS